MCSGRATGARRAAAARRVGGASAARGRGSRGDRRGRAARERSAGRGFRGDRRRRAPWHGGCSGRNARHHRRPPGPPGPERSGVGPQFLLRLRGKWAGVRRRGAPGGDFHSRFTRGPPWPGIASSAVVTCRPRETSASTAIPVGRGGSGGRPRRRGPRFERPLRPHAYPRPACARPHEPSRSGKPGSSRASRRHDRQARHRVRRRDPPASPCVRSWRRWLGAGIWSLEAPRGAPAGSAASATSTPRWRTPTAATSAIRSSERGHSPAMMRAPGFFQTVQRCGLSGPPGGVADGRSCALRRKRWDCRTCGCAARDRKRPRT